MNHVAIDLGGSKSQVCIRAAEGTILTERSVKTVDLPGFLEDLPQSYVIMETCSESFVVADRAIAAGHKVRVVAATLVRQLGVGQRGIKTDKRDARALSEASCRIELPSVHIRSVTARERLARLGMRDGLVTSRTQLINCVRGWLRTQLIKVRSASENFPDNVRLALQASPTGLPDYVDHMLQAIEGLNKQIAAATTEIEAISHEDKVCRRLMTVSGIGPMTSLTYVSVVDEIARFCSAEGLESYLGLTPGENSSSGRVRRTGITKAGPALLRQYLTQAALTLWRVKPEDPMCQWAERIKLRRGKPIAIIALARKLAGVLYAMWRDESTYQPHRAARAMEASVAA
jgi:transposase